MHDHRAIWNNAHRSPALILLAEADREDHWGQSTPGLLARLEQLLPDVHVTSANGGIRNSLDRALAAAAFLGDPWAVVVRLWNRRPDLGPRSSTPSTVRGLDVAYTEAPPEAEAIANAFHTATLARVQLLKTA